MKRRAQAVEIVRLDGSRALAPAPVLVAAPFAIHRAPSVPWGYNVTHIPTGYSINQCPLCACEVRGILRGMYRRGSITVGEYNDALRDVERGRGREALAYLRRH